MSLGDDSQMLDEGASASLIIVDVLVDGLVADGAGSVDSQVVRNLLWAPVLLEQTDDVFPELRGQMEAAS